MPVIKRNYMPVIRQKPKNAVKAGAGSIKTQSRPIQLPDGRWVSPQAYFIRTGIDPKTGKRPRTYSQIKGFDPKATENLGARFLSRTWMKGYNEKTSEGKKVSLPLPTMNQRIQGGRLSQTHLALINEQVNFTFRIFQKQIPVSKQKYVLEKLKKNISKTTLNVTEVMRSTNPYDNLQEGRELHTFLKNEGKIYKAMVDVETGKNSFAKGLFNDPKARTAPIHETIHALQRLGVIKIDVPFAQAIDKLYGLEKGIHKLDTHYKINTNEEFDRKPSINYSTPTPKGIINYNEPNWSYISGIKIAQWVYEKVPKNYRWQYMIDRCNGKTHAEALGRIPKRTSEQQFIDNTRNLKRQKVA